MPARMSEKREQEILRAYEAWDPETGSVDDLAMQLGVARQTLYLVLNRHGVTPKSGRRRSGPDVGQVAGDLVDRMAQNALRTLMDELVSLRNRVAELEAENEKLRTTKRR